MKQSFAGVALLAILSGPAEAETFKAEPFVPNPGTSVQAAKPTTAVGGAGANAQNGRTQALVPAVATNAYVPTAAERNAKDSAAPIRLTQNGKALVPLVIATKASDETKKTAQELMAFLERITGAKFEVQTPDGKAASLAPHERPKIPFAEANAAMIEYARSQRALPAEAIPAAGLVVGTANEWQVPAGLQSGLAMDGVYNGREAFAIRADARRLLLLGATNGALTHAVTRLLEEMGCRWFTPGANWEIVPTIPTLSFGRDITDRPSIGTRIIAFMDGVTDDAERAAQGKWMRRNYIGASFGSNVGHNWQAIAEANNDTLVAHPEYIAEVNGKNQVSSYVDKNGKTIIRGVFTKFELANPVVRKMFVDYALNYFRQNPEADMVSLSPTDGGGFSNSAASQKLGTISDAVYGMVNEVARAVAAEFRGKMVGCYAYRETAAPPSFEMEPNVYIEVATLFNMSTFPTEQLLEMWPKKARNVGVYRYFSYFDAGGSDMPGGPVSSINWLKNTIPTDYERNTAALFAQSSNAFAMQMRGYLVASRLMWNPRADVDAILQDFYDKAYGPAAAPMKRFHERVSQDSKIAVNVYSLGASFRDVDEATKLAKNRPDVLARLGDIKMYLRWYHLRDMLMNTSKSAPEYSAAYLATMRAAAAMQPAYMAQYNMINKSGSRGAATLKDIKPADWNVTVTPPLETIEADFQDSLKKLPTTAIPEVRYDLTDLVPVVFPPAPNLQFVPNRLAYMIPADPLKRREVYQLGSPNYYLYSYKGEPVEVDVQAGVRVPGGMPGKWTLSKPDGKGDWIVIDKGQVPSDNTSQKLSIKVPGKGAYAFSFNGQNSWGFVDTRIDKPATVNATGATDYAAPFIYVPKGTKEIWVSWNEASGGAASLLMPDGKEAIVLGRGIYTIPVPAGMDGQLWRLGKNSRFRFQQFFNIPNLGGGSPESLMVPREVAIKDGLTIRTN